METNMQVQVICEEILKPSSQTPDHLRNHKLSLLDQIQPPIYIPLIFFYEAQELNNSTTTHAQISQKLKETLSNTLTTFYPLAGTFDQENFDVDCNDDGVKYIEARVHTRLSDVIQDPRAEQLKHYLPKLIPNQDEDGGDDHDYVNMALQVSFFDCGGVAIGVRLLHYIGDIESLVAFMSYWAATCRGGAEDKLVKKPSFDLASHFPARDLSQTNLILLPSATITEEEYGTKRLVFGKEKLKALKAAATTSSPGSLNNDVLKDPTRVELVSSFIWKHFIEITMLEKTNRIFGASQAVNLRKRIGPPHYLEREFGNCYMTQYAILDKGTSVPELQDLVQEFRKAIRALDDEYIRKSLSQGDKHDYVDEWDKNIGLLLQGEMFSSNFSSWCRFPLYEVDYGWGKPVWVGTTGLLLPNFTVLMDTKDGDGIEAWITTPHDDIGTLDRYYQTIHSNAIMDDNAN